MIASSAVNQDGRSSSLTAPNGPSQQDVIRSATMAAQAAGSDVAALQMHGTGTALGDPIEVGAASSALVTGHRTRPLTLMASKSWIGHAEPAAGVVGLAHAHVASSLARQLPMMHLVHMNEYVAALLSKREGSWSVPRQATPLALPDQASVLCGVSAFAFQGTNAHVLVRSDGPVPGQTPTAPKQVSLLWNQHRHWVQAPRHK